MSISQAAELINPHGETVHAMQVDLPMEDAPLPETVEWQGQVFAFHGLRSDQNGSEVALYRKKDE